MDGLSLRNVDTGIQGADGFQNKSITSSNKITDNTNSGEVADSFAGTLKQAIKSVDALQKEADIKMQKLATGQSTDIHGTMIAGEKAEIALKFMVQVRNKIIDAYHEIMKMQV